MYGVAAVVRKRPYAGRKRAVRRASIFVGRRKRESVSRNLFSAFRVPHDVTTRCTWTGASWRRFTNENSHEKRGKNPNPCFRSANSFFAKPNADRHDNVLKSSPRSESTPITRIDQIGGKRSLRGLQRYPRALGRVELWLLYLRHLLFRASVSPPLCIPLRSISSVPRLTTTTTTQEDGHRRLASKIPHSRHLDNGTTRQNEVDRESQIQHFAQSRPQESICGCWCR